MFPVLKSYWRGVTVRFRALLSFRFGPLWHVSLVFLLASETALAREKAEGVSFLSALDIGVGSVAEDIYLLVLLEQGLSWEGLDVRVSGPLRIRVLDRSPSSEGVLRNQDWDEPSDYMRIFRSISYHRQFEDAHLSLYLGELNGVGLGHGSLVDHYFNSTNVDTYQGGALVGGEWQGNGLEFLLENIVEPELLVGRVYLSPLSWFSGAPWARRLQVGGFVGMDIAAPYRLEAKDPALFLTAGGDISLRAVDEQWLVIMPYTDFVAMDGSLGVHLGVAGDWSISDREDVRLSIRGEYRYVGADYHPAVFNLFYDRNRFFYPVEESEPQPALAEQISDTDDLPTRHAFMVDTVVEWAGGVRFGCRYDTEGRDRRHWILFRLEIFPWDGYSFGAFYGGQDVRGGGAIFSRDAFIGFSARGQLWGPFNIFADFTRRWRQIDGRQIDGRQFYGQFEMVNEISGGFGMLFVY